MFSSLWKLIRPIFYSSSSSNNSSFSIITSNHDYISGNGSDILVGNSGNDNLTGGKGSDNMDGGAGNDVYNYSKGDGKDIITDISGNDSISLKGISRNDILFCRSGDDLIIEFKGNSADQITIKNQFGNNAKPIETLNFDDDLPAINLLTINSYYILYDVSNSHFVPATLDKNTNYAIISDGSYNDYFNTKSGNDYIDSGAGNDTLYTGDGNDIIFAGAGNDNITSGDGNDVVNAGIGDDSITDYSGDDIYQYAKGDGRDQIWDWRGNDVIVFDKSVSAQNLIFNRVGDNLVITFSNSSTDQITILDQFKVTSGVYYRQIEELRFTNPLTGSSGSIETIVKISQIPPVFYSRYVGNNISQGANTNNLLIDSTLGNDTIISGLGNDVINSGDGNDVITAGKGNDEINGGAGNDIYNYAKGDGIDTILDSSGADKISLNQISQSDIYYAKRGNDLVIRFKDSLTDQIIIKNQFGNGSSNLIEKILIAGVNYDLPKITTLLAYQEIDGTNVADNINQSANNQKLAINAGDGNDSIQAGLANDIINAGNGDDIITGHKGDDEINGGAGNDTYNYSKGDGIDTILDASGTDRISLNGILPSDVYFVNRGSDLIIRFKGSDGDQIIIKEGTIIESVIFDNNISGVAINIADRLTANPLYVEINGTDNADVISYSDNVKYIINAGNGNDIITSGLADDIINAGAGNDIITAGKGNDFIIGGAGDDVYNYAKGDGKDVVTDSAGNDIISITQFSLSDIYYVKRGNDLVIKFKGSNEDEITIKDQFNTSGPVVEKLRIGSDPRTLSPTAFYTEINGDFANNNLDYHSSNNNLAIDSGVGNDQIISGAGNDIIYSGAGNDAITAGAGLDEIYDVSGDDTYYYQAGNGKDIVLDSAGNDILVLNNLARNQVYSVRRGLDIIIKNKLNDSDEFIVKNYYSSDTNKIENIRFSDGTTARFADLDSPASYTEINISESIKAEGSHYSSGSYYVINHIPYDITTGLGGSSFAYNKIVAADGTTTYRYSYDPINGVNFYFVSDFYIDQHLSSSNLSVNSAGTNSYVSTGSGNDVVIASGSSSNAISTSDGNDVINVVNGYFSWLYGGLGDDTYIVQKSIIQTIIYETASGFDTLILRDALQSDVYYLKRGNDLVIRYKQNEYSEVTIKDELKNSEFVIATDPNNGIEAIKFSDGTVINISDITLSLYTEIKSVGVANIDQHSNRQNLYIDGGYKGGSIISGSGDDQIFLMGYKQNSVINAGDGNDYVNYNGFGNSSIAGGRGDDYITASSGNNIINFSLGDGRDTLFLTGGTGFDTLFLHGIAKSSVIYSKVGDNLVINFIGNSSDQITIKDFYHSYYYRKLEFIKYDDGTTDPIGYEIINHSAAGDPNHSFTATAAGRYYINYGDGNDTIAAGYGNDIITAGKGNDTINGGGGDDIYNYSRGDGTDTITDTYGYDIISLSNILQSDILLIKKENGDFIIRFKNEDNDQIIIKSGVNIEGVIFSDTGFANIIDISNQLTVTPLYFQIDGGTSGNDTITQSTNSANLIIDTGNGNDIILSGSGNDIIDSGAGSDQVRGGAGHDVFLYKNLSSSIDGSFDTISDFTKGEDIFDFSNQATHYTAIVNREFYYGITSSKLFFYNEDRDGITYTIIDDLDSNFKIELVGDIYLTNSDVIF